MDVKLVGDKMVANIFLCLSLFLSLGTSSNILPGSTFEFIRDFIDASEIKSILIVMEYGNSLENDTNTASETSYMLEFVKDLYNINLMVSIVDFPLR